MGLFFAIWIGHKVSVRGRGAVFIACALSSSLRSDMEEWSRLIGNSHDRHRHRRRNETKRTKANKGLDLCGERKEGSQTKHAGRAIIQVRDAKIVVYLLLLPSTQFLHRTKWKR